MKISTAIKNHKGKPYYIENTTSEDFVEFVKDYGCKIGVEVGVFMGEFTRKLAKSGMTLYGIDPWGQFPDYPKTDRNFLEKWESMYEISKENTKDCPNVTLIRKTSMDAVISFPVESLDFVYIDGNHKFKYIAEDLYEWAKRVKSGGIISGHDYYNSNDPAGLVKCKDVIDAYVKSYNVESFYTFAGHIHRNDPGKSRDRWPSWFWIKQ